MAIAEGAVPEAKGIGNPSAVSFPALSKVKISTALFNWSATYKKFPLEGTATATGSLAGNGEPGTAVNPALDPMEKTEILFDNWFATKRNLPPGSIARATGLLPAGTPPLIAVKAPFEPMEKRSIWLVGADSAT